MALRLKQVPPLQGALWVRQGLRAFGQRALGFTSLIVAFFFATMVVSVVLPVVGSVIALMALPLLSLGAMAGTRAMLQGAQVHPGQLIEPLREKGSRRTTLLKLCALYGGLTVLILLLSQWLAGDVMGELQKVYQDGAPASGDAASGPASSGSTDTADPSGSAPSPGAPPDPRLLQALGLQALLVSLLSIPFWHAPPLIAWGGQGLAQSLFSSTLAVWRSKGAFVVYALVWFALMILLGTLAALVTSVLGIPRFAAVAALPMALMVMTAFYASLYFTFVDSFELDAAA